MFKVHGQLKVVTAEHIFTLKIPLEFILNKSFGSWVFTEVVGVVA